jgi:hypothetical protein
MIDHRTGMPSGRQAWMEHLHEVFRSLDIPRGTIADNLTSSVAEYCRLYHPHGVQSSDLNLLVARAFCAINDQASAARVLRSMKPHALHVDRWLEILSELHYFPAMLPYFSLGIIRPADWAGAQLDRMWTLDLSRLALSESEKHEMMLYRSIRTLIENMYVFWEATRGEGVLGVKGLNSFRVDSGTSRLRTFTGAKDLLGYIGDLFLTQRDARGWQAVPVLMNLDL